MIFHSDRGTEYAGYVIRDRLADLGIVQNMNERMNDNAYMESFYHSLKSEVIPGAMIESESQLLQIIRAYMHFYNERRLHSSIGYMTPAMYEQSFQCKGVN